MKKTMVWMIVSALILSSCASSRVSGDPGAVMAGASIGGTLGSAIGGLVGENNHGWRGGYRGSAIGTIVGTIAGAAIGNAVSTPRQQDDEFIEIIERKKQPTTIPRKHQRPVSNAELKIRNVRFIDANRNHVIDAGESSKVIFEVVNEGRTVIRNVVPIVEETTEMRNLYISPSVMIEQVAPGEGIRYTAMITAGEKLKTGEAVIRVAIAENNNAETDWLEFTLPTQKKMR